MNQQWVEMKNAQKLDEINGLKNKILRAIDECSFATDELRQKMRERLFEYEREPYHTATAMFLLISHYNENVELKEIEDFLDYIDLDSYIMSLRYCTYNRYLDSEPIAFCGDILITDPCYIIKHRDETTRPKWHDFMKLDSYQGMTKQQMIDAGYFEDYAKMEQAMDAWDKANPDDWDICECGYEMDKIGFKTWMTRDTLYGDWGCHVFNSDTKEVIGQFCADSGMVGVFDLNEVLTYNPDFNNHIEKLWTSTVIKDFKGMVQFVITENKNSKHEDFNVHVVGKGINTKTGKQLNFISSQTGL